MWIISKMRPTWKFCGIWVIWSKQIVIVLIVVNGDRITWMWPLDPLSVWPVRDSCKFSKTLLLKYFYAYFSSGAWAWPFYFLRKFDISISIFNIRYFFQYHEYDLVLVVYCRAWYYRTCIRIRTRIIVIRVVVFISHTTSAFYTYKTRITALLNNCSFVMSE
jgi:hypothetical protein